MTDYRNPGSYWQQRLSRAFDLTGAGFIALGPEYNLQLYRVRSETLDSLLQRLQVNVSQFRVLELGCGTGFYTEYFTQRKVESYTGIDITSVSVQRLQQQYPQWHFFQADITAPHLPVNRTFDLVLIADVLFHIVDDQRFIAVLRNVAQVLRPGGLLILSDVLGNHTVQTAAHCRWRSYDDYQMLLHSASFQPTLLMPIFASLHPPTDIPTNAWQWKAYAQIWKYTVLFRLTRLRWFDFYVPRLLSWLDKAILLSRFGMNAPNSKWLSAVCTHAPEPHV